MISALDLIHVQGVCSDESIIEIDTNKAVVGDERGKMHIYDFMSGLRIPLYP